MSKYTLMLRESPDAFANYSPAELQSIFKRYSAWADGLRQASNLAGSQKLRDGEGRVIRRNGGRVMVTDGPFAEGKEVLGGLFVIEAGSYDEALKIANECPHLDYGSIEVREVEILR